ncbi:MAG: response regulator [Cyanobacteriota bacterium]
MFSKFDGNSHLDIEGNFYTLEGLRVLVVDDDVDSLELTCVILEQYGVEIAIAASASEAIEINTKFHPELLICDIGMPVMDGYSLIRKIRTLPPEQGGLIPAIAMTAYAGEQERTQALNAGFQRHISKPVDPNNLVAVVASLAKCLSHNEEKVA